MVGLQTCQRWCGSIEDQAVWFGRVVDRPGLVGQGCRQAIFLVGGLQTGQVWFGRVVDRPDLVWQGCRQARFGLAGF